jgi:hypothetical protein
VGTFDFDAQVEAGVPSLLLCSSFFRHYLSREIYEINPNML